MVNYFRRSNLQLPDKVTVVVNTEVQGIIRAIDAGLGAKAVKLRPEQKVTARLKLDNVRAFR